jgi:hypothetical protein
MRTGGASSTHRLSFLNRSRTRPVAVTRFSQRNRPYRSTARVFAPASRERAFHAV